MRRELKRCTGYIDAELAEDQSKWFWDLAETWRMRQFAPDLYLRESEKYLESLRAKQKPRWRAISVVMPSRSHAEISNLGNSDDSSEEEMEPLPGHRSDPTEVGKD